MIIGTAGHIDHGKTALIEALTGSRMDRLREERDRGITIELNFAPFDLADGRVAGVIDVPGHEDFVRTMVAGASGIDLLLLVIAADEGIKPQTREHLAIAEQLGIRRGIPVITKADLVEPEWASLMEIEISEWLKSSTIAFEPPRLVSVVSGRGVPELTSHLREVASAFPERNGDDVFRLPVDRSFSVAGIGTVVTGTAWSGQVAPGDQVMILPGRKSARVRTVQVHGKDVPRSEPGMRVALGLAGIGREQITRGDTIVLAESAWETSLALDVMLTLLPGAPRVIISRSRVRLHLGTSEIIARVFPRESRIEPGSTGLARLALESPGVARGGDAFVIRGFSPVTTIGGGRIVDPLPPRRKTIWPGGLGDQSNEGRLNALIARRPHGAQSRQVPLLLGASPAVTQELLDRSNEYVRAEDYWVRRETITMLGQAAVKAVEDFHRARPQDPGIPLAELRQGLHTTPWLVSTILTRLGEEERVVSQEGVVRLPAFRPRFQGGNDIVARVVSQVRRAGLTPPSTSELSQSLGVGDLGPTLRLAAKDGLLEPVERDRYYSREALETFVTTLAEVGKAGLITPGQIRDRLGITRKYLIPLLEWSDGKGITVRVEEGRRLRDGAQLPWRGAAT